MAWTIAQENEKSKVDLASGNAVTREENEYALVRRGIALGPQR
jgi:hypothetical protein